MRHLIFILLLCFFTNKSFAQSDDYSLHFAPDTYDTVCVKQFCEQLLPLQYWRLNAKNSKSSYQILKEWKSFYKIAEGVEVNTGFLTIRFVVNCKGEPCCFRFYEVDKTYKKINFSEDLKSQLTMFVKQLGGWKLVKYEGVPTDYYYYLTFKIQDNDFKTVAP